MGVAGVMVPCHGRPTGGVGEVGAAGVCGFIMGSLSVTGITEVMDDAGVMGEGRYSRLTLVSGIVGTHGYHLCCRHLLSQVFRTCG